jgi:hypothetical protein
VGERGSGWNRLVHLCWTAHGQGTSLGAGRPEQKMYVMQCICLEGAWPQAMCWGWKKEIGAGGTVFLLR